MRRGAGLGGVARSWSERYAFFCVTVNLFLSLLFQTPLEIKDCLNLPYKKMQPLYKTVASSASSKSVYIYT